MPINLGSLRRGEGSRRRRMPALPLATRRDGGLACRRPILENGTIPMQGVTVVDHPLVQHKLTLMRDKTTSDRRISASCSARSRCSSPMR